MNGLFTRANSDDIQASAPVTWEVPLTDVIGSPSIASNELVVGNTGGAGHIQIAMNGGTSANQISEFTFRSTASNGRSGPGVRMTYGLGDLYGYVALYTPASTRIDLYVFNNVNVLTGAVGVILGTYTVTLVAADRVRIHVNGTTLNVYVNDVVVIGPIVNTDIAGGGLYSYCGLLAIKESAGTINWDNFRGGADGWV